MVVLWIGHRGSRPQGLQDAIKHPGVLLQYKLPGTDFWFCLLLCPQHSEQWVAPRRHSVTIYWEKEQYLEFPPGNRASRNVNHNSRSLPPLDLSKF